MSRERIRIERTPRIVIPPKVYRGNFPDNLTILDCIHDVFKPWFKRLEDWNAWLAFLCALFALPMSKSQLEIYRECTNRQDPPTEPAHEAALVCGRRAGKSFILSLLAVFIACFLDHRPFLSSGERAVVMVIATNRRQARVIMRYIRALLEVPMLKRMVERETLESFDLDNQCTIEVHTASFRSTRGYAIVAALLDELAFWRSEESQAPDHEVVRALRPGMAQFPNSMLLLASSPYARKGVLWNVYKKHFGKNSSTLVWQAPTRRMNPKVPQNIIDAAVEEDPAAAQAEWFAQFRQDIEGYVTREALDAVIANGVFQRRYVPGMSYRAFVDPSGGSNDAMTLGIGHREKDMVIVDCVIERKPPFSPDEVVTEFAQVLKSFHCSKVTGDRYAGEFAREPFKKLGIKYELSQKPKSDLYRDFLPLVNAKRVTLIDNERLVNQLLGLERRVARSGKDSIDHGPNGHDDVANAVAGVCSVCAPGAGAYDTSLSWVTGGKDDKPFDYLGARLVAYAQSGGRRF